ncbi:MBL fold metallo-hydrolase [candidate division KSB1 bacterium]
MIGIVLLRMPLVLCLSIPAVLFLIIAETFSDKTDNKRVGASPSLTVVYDNIPHDGRLKTDWGFGCVIRLDGGTMLFDTGEQGPILLNNMAQVGVDPKRIDTIALSHIHSDHVGGLDDFLSLNNNVDIYAPASFPDSFKLSVAQAGGRLHNLVEPASIADGIYSTGDLDGEAALAIDTDKGLIVITGCAHPGVVRLVQRAKKISGRPVELVLGGFHLLDKSEGQVESVIKSFRRLGVRTVAPTHCTGADAIKMFQAEYGKYCRDIGAGWVHVF